MTQYGYPDSMPVILLDVRPHLVADPPNVLDHDSATVYLNYHTLSCGMGAFSNYHNAELLSGCVPLINLIANRLYVVRDFRYKDNISPPAIPDSNAIQPA